MKYIAQLVHRKLWLSFIFIFAGYYVGGYMLASKCNESCMQSRSVTDEFNHLINQAQTGDLILVHSPDFFSRMIAAVDDCHFSGTKIVYEEKGQHPELALGKYLLVSEADTLDDTINGLFLSPMDEYFYEYDQVRIGLFRPKNFTSDHLSAIHSLIDLGLSPEFSGIAYDFNFDNNTDTDLTCHKLLIRIFDDMVLDRSRENTIYKASFPCDLREENLTQIGSWTSYWKNQDSNF